MKGRFILLLVFIEFTIKYNFDVTLYFTYYVCKIYFDKGLNRTESYQFHNTTSG